MTSATDAATLTNIIKDVLTRFNLQIDTRVAGSVMMVRLTCLVLYQALQRVFAQKNHGR